MWTSSSFIRAIGKLGVMLFFTLSGFLITYLLLIEEKEKGKINIKQFYIRRMLRIWPLYYLIFFLAFFVLANLSFFRLPNVPVVKVDDFTTITCFIFFLSNYYLAFFAIFPYAAQTWSVSTEEQFYLVWPWILKFSKNKLLSLIFVVAIVTLVNVFFTSHYSYVIENRIKYYTFWNMFNIDCMAIGGIFAYLLFIKAKILKYIMNKYFFAVIILFIITELKFEFYIPIVTKYFPNEMWGILFGLVILNLSSVKELKSLLENRLFNYLGTISYGLYMFQGILVVTVMKLAIQINFTNDIFIYTASILLTIVVAHFSYFYFEKWFLKLKHKFTVIKTL